MSGPKTRGRSSFTPAGPPEHPLNGDGLTPLGSLAKSPLGQKVDFSAAYDPTRLCPVPRAEARLALGLDPNRLPFFGEDVWNCWELSWLGPSGRPEAAVLELRMPADSPCLVESKSLKLYLNSLNMTVFSGQDELKKTLVRDISKTIGAPVRARIFSPDSFFRLGPADPPGLCLDGRDHRPGGGKGLAVEETAVSEELFSNLLRTKCPVTGQPDWATLIIRYAGRKIVPESLLGYIVSLREESGFHETCVEMIFNRIIREAAPDRLAVEARFTRRGGIDINPLRSTERESSLNIRTFRQ